MLKKMLGKKNSVSQDTSSSEDEETIKVEKRKKSSSTNLKAMFQVSPKDKSPTITKGNIRSRRASSSEGSRRGSMVQKRSG